MAATRANAASRSDENFDPESELIKEEQSDTVAINLPGFKKDELKVALTDPQNLKITGSRNLGDNKWSRFEKNVPIPEDGDVNRLKAKFDNGVLYIIMPRQPRALTKPTLPPLPPPPSDAEKPATERKPQVPLPPKPAPGSPPSQKPETKTQPETSLQKPASEPRPAPKPETKSQIPPPETDLQKPPSEKPVSEPKVQPEPSEKPVSPPETPVQPKPTQVDQQKNEKVGEPTAAPKAKEGGGDADDGGARVKNMSFGGCATAATFASDLTTGLYKPKQLIINVVVGVLVVLALVIYVRRILGRSFPGATDE